MPKPHLLLGDETDEGRCSTAMAEAAAAAAAAAAGAAAGATVVPGDYMPIHFAQYPAYHMVQMAAMQQYYQQQYSHQQFSQPSEQQQTHHPCQQQGEDGMDTLRDDGNKQPPQQQPQQQQQQPQQQQQQQAERIVCGKDVRAQHELSQLSMPMEDLQQPMQDLDSSLDHHAATSPVSAAAPARENCDAAAAPPSLSIVVVPGGSNNSSGGGNIVTGMPLSDFAQQWQLQQQQQQAAMFWWWQMWMNSMYGNSIAPAAGAPAEGAPGPTGAAVAASQDAVSMLHMHQPVQHTTQQQMHLGCNLGVGVGCSMAGMQASCPAGVVTRQMMSPQLADQWHPQPQSQQAAQYGCWLQGPPELPGQPGATGSPYACASGAGQQAAAVLAPAVPLPDSAPTTPAVEAADTAETLAAATSNTEQNAANIDAAAAVGMSTPTMATGTVADSFGAAGAGASVGTASVVTSSQAAAAAMPSGAGIRSSGGPAIAGAAAAAASAALQSDDAGTAKRQRAEPVAMLEAPAPAAAAASAAGSSPVAATYNNQPKRGRKLVKEQKVCKNCGTRNTPFWRKDKNDGRPLCNACGLYFAKNDMQRPKVLWKEGEGSVCGPGTSASAPPPPAALALKPGPGGHPSGQHLGSQAASTVIAGHMAMQGLPNVSTVMVMPAGLSGMLPMGIIDPKLLSGLPLAHLLPGPMAHQLRIPLAAASAAAAAAGGGSGGGSGASAAASGPCSGRLAGSAGAGGSTAPPMVQLATMTLQPSRSAALQPTGITMSQPSGSTAAVAAAAARGTFTGTSVAKLQGGGVAHIVRVAPAANSMTLPIPDFAMLAASNVNKSMVGKTTVITPQQLAAAASTAAAASSVSAQAAVSPASATAATDGAVGVVAAVSSAGCAAAAAIPAAVTAVIAHGGKQEPMELQTAANVNGGESSS